MYKKEKKRNEKGQYVQQTEPNSRILENVLQKIYYDPRHNASFSSIADLYHAAKYKVRNLRKSDVKKWLSNQTTYILHKSTRNKFPRRKVLVKGPKYQFQADLLDMQNKKNENDGTKYLLTVIDCFSRLATAIPLKFKTGKSTREGLKKAFKKLGFPKKLQTDRGPEFYNEKVKNYLKRNNIQHFSTSQLDTKAQMVERFNRTLRERIEEYLDSKKHLITKGNYVHSLEDLLHGYNTRLHGAFKNKFAPVDINMKNRKIVFDLLYKDYLNKIKPKFKFQIGDIVLLALTKKILEKNTKTFSPTKYIIIDRHLTEPVSYSIKNIATNEIKEGTYYHEQLQRIEID